MHVSQQSMWHPVDPEPGCHPGLFVGGLRRGVGGFTLTELIVVIVMAGILAAMILPRWRGETGFEERGLRDQTAAALRYAQKSAIASRRLVCVTFTATTVRADIAPAFGAANCTGGAALPGPDTPVLAVDATGSAQFSAFPGGLNFDAAGRSTGTVIQVQGLPAALAITVEAGTGYVH